MLSCLVGSGAQVGTMFFAMFFAIICAFGNTNWRPFIGSIIVTTLVFNGFMNGYVTSRYLKFFGTTDLWLSTTLSAVALPIFLIVAMAIERFTNWTAGGINRDSFFSTVFYSLIWYSIHAVMCYLGAFRGYTKIAAKPAAPIGKVPRPIPKQPFYQSVYILAPICGFVQFIAIYTELNYVYQCITNSNMYGMFAWLFLAMITQIAIISLLSIICTYMQLCNQNYQWWWKSFIIGASGSFYIAAYFTFAFLE